MSVPQVRGAQFTQTRFFSSLSFSLSLSLPLSLPLSLSLSLSLSLFLSLHLNNTGFSGNARGARSDSAVPRVRFPEGLLNPS